MGFFNAGLLWFALGGLVPVIIHLLHRQKFRRVRWAAMEFLLAALKKTQRRMRLESLLLLLLRILIMVLLAMAVARPFFTASAVGVIGDTDAHHIFVLDVSASMGYKRAQNTSLDVAKDAAEKVLRDIQPSEQDKFTLVTLSSYPESVQRSRQEQIRTALNELQPTHLGTSMLATMLEIRNVLDASKNKDRRVYIFTDLQRVAWEFRDDQEAERFVQLLKELSHRENTRFFIYDVGTGDAINQAVVGLRTAHRVVSNKRTTRLIASVHNYSSTPFPAKEVSLYVDGARVKTELTPLPANATTEVVFELNFVESRPHLVHVALDPDYVVLDDARYLALDVKDSLRCLTVDGEPGASRTKSETFIFALALDPTREGRYFSVDVKVANLFSVEALDRYDFLVLANVESLTSDKVEKVEQFVRRGGGLFLTLGNQVNKVSFNQYFWKGGEGLSPAELDEIAGVLPGAGLERGTERRIAKFQSEHPVFRMFRDKLAAAPYGLVFYRHYRVKGFEPERVLARFDDNFSSPVLLEKKFGEGKVVLFTSTLDQDWNAGIQGQPPWLVLMWEICQYLASRPQDRRNLFIGDLIHLEVPVERYQKEFQLHTPEEGILTLSPSAPEAEDPFFTLDYPVRAKSDDPKVLRNEGLRHAGGYRIVNPAASDERDKVVAVFAVNLPPVTPSPEEVHLAEGNMDLISPEEIRNLFKDFKVEFLGKKKAGQQEIDVAPPSGNIWKYLLYLLLGFLLIESVMALLFGRAKQ